ncbi:MAG: tRNA pseudouridine(38-40) synthase TruA [Chlorobi bacterium]|nr:tRNA pseudouridine(38-40) synthase TruA [Chlorobiota bacterium]
MRYFIELAYKGTRYHGWQVQPNAETVQERLDDALNKAIRGEDIHVTGAGRTDTGVHASYFVAHFDVETEIEDTGLVVHKLNRILPDDIVVYSLTRVPEEAHSRFSAVERTYNYFLTVKRNPFFQELVYRIPFEPDFDLMNKAAATLSEYEDFTSFSKLHTDTKTNNCKVVRAYWKPYKDMWVFTITADRFLRNMVRAVTGTLFDVGRGRLTTEEFRHVIEAKDRGRAGTSAPAHGLYLADIVYPENVFTKTESITNLFL